MSDFGVDFVGGSVYPYLIRKQKGKEMFEVWMQWTESPEVTCDSLSTAQAWIDGQIKIKTARSIAWGGKAYTQEDFDIVEVTPLTAQQVADALAEEVAELADFLA